MNHFANVCKQPDRPRGNQESNVNTKLNEVAIEENEENEVSGFLAAMMISPPTSPETTVPILAALRDQSKSKWNTVPVPHFIFDTVGKSWIKQPPTPPPVIQVILSLDRRAYSELAVNAPELTKKPGTG